MKISIRETLSSADERVQIEARLGFGHADVVVAVPEVWYDVSTWPILMTLPRISASAMAAVCALPRNTGGLTQQFFSQMHGIQVYRIVESLGATEGAPASGSADIIVDITSTGSTLHANHLKVLDDGVILKSQACLVSSRGTADANAVEELSQRIKAALDKG